MQDSQESSESMDSSATINGQDGGDLDEQDPFDNNEFLNHAWLYNIAIPDNLYPQGPLLISPLFKKKKSFEIGFLVPQALCYIRVNFLLCTFLQVIVL